MKTEFKLRNIDNIANTSLIAICLFAVAGSVFASNPAAARAPEAVQKIDAIVVTAPRLTNAATVKLDTIVVTASRLSKLA